MDLIVVYVLPNRSGSTRFGFSVSRKLGKAVERNRVKRLLREAARALLPEVTTGFDVVVVARRRVSGVGLEKISPALRELLRRSGILKARD